VCQSLPLTLMYARFLSAAFARRLFVVCGRSVHTYRAAGKAVPLNDWRVVQAYIQTLTSELTHV
jgi:hypothetical protein